jgi:hypothetical protein
MTLPRLTRQLRQEALERAMQARREREARSEREALDEWPDGPPEGDEKAMERYLIALRQWHQNHVSPVSDVEWRQVRADHGLSP